MNAEKVEKLQQEEAEAGKRVNFAAVRPVGRVPLDRAIPFLPGLARTVAGIEPASLSRIEKMSHYLKVAAIAAVTVMVISYVPTLRSMVLKLT